MLDRRTWLRSALGGAALLMAGGTANAKTLFAPIKMTVYKSPTCGCCTKWVDHVRAAGFQLTVHDVDDVDAIKTKHGLPAKLASCHTGLVNGYVVEGHVPASAITKMVTEKPAIAGIAAPGMPMGSPGMEVGRRKDPFDIIAFDKAGKTYVFAKG